MSAVHTVYVYVHMCMCILSRKYYCPKTILCNMYALYNPLVVSFAQHAIECWAFRELFEWITMAVVMGLFGWTMCSVLEMKQELTSAIFQDGEYTTVAII